MGKVEIWVWWSGVHIHLTILYYKNDMMVQWVAWPPHSSRVPGLPLLSLELCMLFLCLCGFTPCSQTSFINSQRIYQKMDCEVEIISRCDIYIYNIHDTLLWTSISLKVYSWFVSLKSSNYLYVISCIKYNYILPSFMAIPHSHFLLHFRHFKEQNHLSSSTDWQKPEEPFAGEAGWLQLPHHLV